MTGLEPKEMNQRPPLDIEQALDLVLAFPAHRSQNVQHATFGQLLLQEYLVKLRERYAHDERAVGYLDNLFACIANAVRGFSVERDIFGTRWQSMLEQRKYEIERANRLDRYSPFREDGVWGKTFAVIGGASGGAVAGELVKGIAANSNLLVIACSLFGIVLGLFLFDFVLDTMRNRLLKRVEAQFPRDLVQTWQSETMVNYKKILRQFLWSAIKVREEWYPELPTLNGQKVFSAYQVSHLHFLGEGEELQPGQPADLLNAELDKIIERHMALG